MITLRFISIIVLVSWVMSGCSGGGGGGGTPEQPDNVDNTRNDPNQDQGSNDDITEPTPEPSWEILSLPAGAQINVYAFSDLEGSPVYTTQATLGPDPGEGGKIQIPQEEVVDGEFYLLTATDGQELDADNDGQADETPLEIKGKLHALLTAEQIKNGEFYVSILSEIIYQRAYFLLAGGYSKEAIKTEIDRRARVLLSQDITQDNNIDWDDIAHWRPRENQDSLRHSIADYEALTGLILENEPWSEKVFQMSEPVLSTYGGVGTEWDVAIQEQVAYVLLGSGFACVDISQPNRLLELGTAGVEGNSRAIVVDGDYAYVAIDTINFGDHSLAIYDISEPAMPQQIGSLEGARGTAVAKTGHYIYLVDGVTHVVDVQDPANPVEVDTIGAGMRSFEKMLVVGDYLYAFTLFEVEVFKLTDPAAPVHVNTIALSFAYDFDVDNGLLITTEGEVVDLIDPETATVNANLTLDFPRAATLDIQGDELLVSVGQGIDIYDISDLAHPVRKGRVPVLATGAGLHRFGNYVLLSESNADLQSVDLAAMMVGDEPDVVGSATSDRAPVTLDVNGSTAYLMTDRDLNIFDVSDPSVPIRLSNTDINGRPNDIKVRGDYAYIANGKAGLTVYNVSNTALPAFVEMNSTDDNAWGIELFGNYAYVSHVGSGIHLFDLSTPGNPEPVGTVPGSASLNWNSAITADYAYMADGTIRILKWESATSVSEGATIPIGAAIDIKYSDNRLYVSTGRSGFAVADVSNHDEPNVLYRINTPGFAAAIYKSGAYVYVADSGGGLRVYKLSESAAPQIIGRLHTAGDAQDIIAFEDYIYTAGGEGLVIYRTPRLSIP